MASDTTPNAVAPPPASLQECIQTLTDTHIRLQTLRHVPTVLLRPPSADFPPPFDSTMDREFAVTFNSTPAHDFQALKDFLEVLCSDKVQEALQAARASEEADQSELGLSFQREHRKRKQPQSPVGSPQPYVPSPPRSLSLFAPPEDDPPPMRADALAEFVRDFNRGSSEAPSADETETALPKCRLAIWSRTKSMRDELKAASCDNIDSTSGTLGLHAGKLTSPVVLRFMISDVLTAYISLMFSSLDNFLVVDSVTAFGPRERKLAHEQSDYLVFQGLSQYIAKMVLSHPRVPVQILMSVLVSYRGLFIDRCTSCQRVLSAEGHIPPVARVWVPKGSETVAEGPSTADVESRSGTGYGTDHGSGRWEPRHASCLYH